VVPVIVVELTTVTPVAETPPSVSVAPVTKFVPVTVTKVPPASGPQFGLTEVMRGLGPSVGVSVGVGDLVAVGVRVGVDVFVGVGVGVDVAIGVFVGVKVLVGVNV
jgi:hypothetical protein